jgi:serine protease
VAHRVLIGHQAPVAAEQAVTLPGGVSPLRAAAAIRRQPGVAYAVPDYIAHAAGGYIPNDPGRSHHAGGWQQLQWNYLAVAGVDAPTAWANLIADHRAGGKGVKIAVIDTGVAFEDWQGYHRSPDFTTTKFVDPCDLVSGKLVAGKCTDPDPVDREGHGTFVAGMIAESTDNRVGVTGLAYGASIMPVRVLDGSGLGDSSVIAAGIRYAVQRGAQVINLSLEFYLGITSGDIPDIVSAIRYAHQHGVVVVAAAGNDAASQIAYPARTTGVISVGATTLDRCLANYSNVGSRLDLVAPGGGEDSSTLPDDPDCHPNRRLPDVYQMTFNDPSRPNDFTLPSGWYGTSMAAPMVSAAAALVIASGVIGRHPSPDATLARLEETAEPLGPVTPNSDYGYGLINAGAATAKVVQPSRTVR